MLQEDFFILAFGCWTKRTTISQKKDDPHGLSFYLAEFTLTIMKEITYYKETIMNDEFIDASAEGNPTTKRTLFRKAIRPAALAIAGAVVLGAVIVKMTSSGTTPVQD